MGKLRGTYYLKKKRKNIQKCINPFLYYLMHNWRPKLKKNNKHLIGKEQITLIYFIFFANVTS